MRYLGENEKALEKTNLSMNFGSIIHYVIVGKSLSFSELPIKWVHLPRRVM